MASYQSRGQARGYMGPVRKEPQQQQTICVTCEKPLSADDMGRNAWLCTACADPEGYLKRLNAAAEASRLRMLQAYPVCKHCGKRLPQAWVDAGRDAHTYTPREGCDEPYNAGPLAVRRSA